MEAVIETIRCCSVVYDDSNFELAEIKRILLDELIDYVVHLDNALPEEIYPEAIQMISMNIFQPSSSTTTIEDSRGPFQSWDDLYLVYILFIQLLQSPHFGVDTAQQYIDQDFVTKVLRLFESEDQRERDVLKAVVYQLYKKFVDLRPYIAKEIKEILHKFMSTEKHHGLNELRETFGTIVTDFLIPDEEEKMAALNVETSLDDSVLISNASDIAVIAARENEKSSIRGPLPKGILIKDGVSSVTRNMEVKFTDEETVHIIASDHDGKQLRSWN